MLLFGFWELKFFVGGLIVWLILYLGVYWYEFFMSGGCSTDKWNVFVYVKRFLKYFKIT